MAPRYAYEPPPQPCQIDGRDRTAKVRRLCPSHYQQRWRDERPDYQREWRAANPEKVAGYRDRYDRRTGRRRYTDG
jgi:hypothetical protein